MSLCNREASVCPSVRPSVCKLCANRYFYHRNDWIATKLAHDGPQMGPHPGCAQGQGQGQRSRDTDTFVISRKSLLLAGKWLDREQTCTQLSQKGLHPRCAQSQGQGRRSRDTGTSVMSQNVYYTVPSERSVSTCTHFTKHRYTLLPVQVSDS